MNKTEKKKEREEIMRFMLEKELVDIVYMFVDYDYLLLGGYISKNILEALDYKKKLVSP